MTMATAGLALVVWTMVIWVWLYAERVPAMMRAKVNLKKHRRAQDLQYYDEIPDRAKWVADNYNHLHEQPVLFYFLVLYSQGYGVADPLNVWLAWGYVAVRVWHSLEQILRNKVVRRFTIFCIGSALLAVIALRNVIAAVL